MHPHQPDIRRRPSRFRGAAMGVAALASLALLTTTPGVWATPQVAAPAAPVLNLGPASQPDAVAGPHVQGNHTVAAYDYAKAIRESVQVTTDFDSDGDGKKDVMMIDIIRPREAAEKGIKVPVIAVPSPYFTTLGRGEKSTRKKFDQQGGLTHMPLFYDNYYVERGYAVAAIDMLGTGRSNGCTDMGGKYDIGGMVSVGKWINGQISGTYKAGGTGEARANGWSTGNYALIGKSYDGTLANGAAAAGAPGLKTIVPIAGISSWYDYIRINGYMRYQAYPSDIANSVGNNRGTCSGISNKYSSAADSSRGSYNEFFRERDYVKDAANVKASIFAAHGHNDLNVMMSNSSKWLVELQKRGVPMKLWVSQVDHKDPFDIRRKEWVDQLTGWFDFWLQGLDNPVIHAPLLDVETSVGQWEARPLGSLDATTAIGLTKGGLGSQGTGTVTAGGDFEGEDAMVKRGQGQQAIFLSAPLQSPFSFAGVSTARLKVKATAKAFPITVKLVDYGPGKKYGKISGTGNQDCWGGKTPTDDSCFATYTEGSSSTDALVVGRGWLSARHRDSLEKPTDVPTGQWITIDVPIMLNAATIPAGHQFGLVVAGHDGTIQKAENAASFEIDLAGSSLMMATSDAGVLRPGK